MTLSLFASHCLALVGLLLAGQQLRDHYVIEFPKLEQEVKNNFGADKVLHVSALEIRLHDLENKAVKEQLIGVNAFFDEHINTPLTMSFLKKRTIGQHLLNFLAILAEIVRIMPLQNT